MTRPAFENRGQERGIHRVAAGSRLLTLLSKELLIGVTRFFRDQEAWENLKSRVIPALIKDRPPSQALRAWVPGCSTGEEAYSLAIVFKEALELLKPARRHIP